MADLKEKAIALLSTTTVSFAAEASTSLYTIPTGKNCIPFGFCVRPGADPVDCTATFGSTGTSANSILDTQTFHTNVDSATEAGWILPVPNATTVAVPILAAGDLVQITIAGGGGGATNSVDFFGFLVDA